MRLILGSTSPRRKEILSFFSYPFEIVSPNFHEEGVLFKGDPRAYALEIAKGKSLSLQEKFNDRLILTADTVVYRDGKVFDKPFSKEHSHKTLEELSGKEHEVFTACVGNCGGKIVERVEKTTVYFHPLTDWEIENYCASFWTHDKAGGYGIQGASGIIVKQIVGCYYNVMGLPLNGLKEVLLEYGVNLWSYLK